MDKTKFKAIFAENAKKFSFDTAYGAYFKEVGEVLVMMYLMKSNYSNFYYLDIKVFIQGTFGKTYFKSKELAQKGVGQIFTRPPEKYSKYFDLDLELNDSERKSGLESMFNDFLVPFIESVKSKDKILNSFEKQQIHLTKAVLFEIEKKT